MIKKIFTSYKVSSWEISSLGLDVPDLFILIVALIAIFVISVLREKSISVREKLASKNIVFRWFIYYLLIFSIIIFGAFGPGYAPVDPIYADF